MTIALLGDIHGDLFRLADVVKLAYDQGCVAVIQVGDFGISQRMLDEVRPDPPMLTLPEWCEQYSVPKHESAYGFRMRVFWADFPAAQDKRNAALWELYHLSDYVVSAAIAGPSYALLPRN